MKKIFILLFILSITSCEKDDICDKETTSRVVIEFYDNLLATNLKNLTSMSATADGFTNPYNVFSSSKIQLPLSTAADFTKYSLVLNSTDAVNLNQDFLQFNYTRKTIFVSRACGYKTVYQLDASNPFTLTDSDPTDGFWIKNIIIDNKTINNETETHVKIYF